MEYIKQLIKTTATQMAGQWSGDENETLDKIEEVCNGKYERRRVRTV